MQTVLGFARDTGLSGRPEPTPLFNGNDSEVGGRCDGLWTLGWTRRATSSEWKPILTGDIDHRKRGRGANSKGNTRTMPRTSKTTQRTSEAAQAGSKLPRKAERTKEKMKRVSKLARKTATKLTGLPQNGTVPVRFLPLQQTTPPISTPWCKTRTCGDTYWIYTSAPSGWNRDNWNGALSCSFLTPQIT
jgi:hypothetical protein